MRTPRSVIGAGARTSVALAPSRAIQFARSGAVLQAADNSGAHEPVQPAAELALFCDATEVLFSLADQRRAADPTAPWVPRRWFVSNADEAHRIAFEGPNPIVGMSLDDLSTCSRATHPKAGQLVGFFGVHRGFLQLMAAPEVKTVTDLKGWTVAVDTDTGYASALFEILRRKGLERGRDFAVVYAGATNLRYQKLCRGEFEATLLGPPFTRLALGQGHRSLATVIGALGGYQAVVLVGRRPWLAENAELTRSVVACLRATLDWAARPDNRDLVETYVKKGLVGLERSAAVQATQDLFGPASEFLPDGRMDDRDTRVVLDLFNASRGTSLPQETVAAIFDASYLN